MNQILFEFHLPGFLKAVFDAIPWFFGLIFILAGFFLLFLPLPDAKKEAPKPARQSRFNVAFWTFVGGLVLLLLGVLSIGVSILNNDDAERQAHNAWVDVKHQYDTTEAAFQNRQALAMQLQETLTLLDQYEDTVAAERALQLESLLEEKGTSLTREEFAAAWRAFSEPFSDDDYRLKPVTVPAYGVMVMLGFIAAILVLYYRAKQYGIDGNIVIDIGIIGMLAGIAGSRLWFVIEYWSEKFIHDPMSMPDPETGEHARRTLGDALIKAVSIHEGGLVFYGGLIGAALGIVIYLKVRKQPLWFFVDFIAVTVPLGHAFGRMGCLLNGCCYGDTCNPHHWLAIVYHVDKADHASRFADQAVYATQGLASVLLFLWFIVLTLYYEKVAKRRGETFWALFVLYALHRFFVQFLRSDVPLYQFAGVELASSQWMSLIAFLIGVPMLLWFRYGRKQEKPPHLKGLDWHPYLGTPPPVGHFLHKVWQAKQAPAETPKKDANPATAPQPA